MQKSVFFIFLLCLFVGMASAYENHNIKLDGPGLRPKIKVEDDVYVYSKHKDIIVENEDYAQEVVISPKGELFIDGKEIRTSRKERELLKEYNELASLAFERAEGLAEDGVKIGLKGAALGLKAATGVFKILLPGYTADDYERDVEKEAEKIEKKAEKLESKAEELEVMMDHLEDIHVELRDRIDALNDLKWF